MKTFTPVIRYAAALALLLIVGLGPAAQADQTSPKLDALFAKLQTVTDPAEAKVYEHIIWKIWTRRGEQIVDSAMTRGIVAMSRQNFETALVHFNDAVTLAPDYAEAWNKRATVYYLLGKYQESVADIQKTLELEPPHFGALSGLGLIYRALGDDRGALTALERVLEIHPLMEGIAEQAERLRIAIEGKPI